MTLRIGSLFTGTGCLDMATASVLGGETAWVSDIDPGACKILAHRYPNVPNLGDITAIDWDTVEPVDVLTGGFPCTDISPAGLALGLTPDTRSGLWYHMATAIDRLRPPLVVIENVRGLLSTRAERDERPGSDDAGPVRDLEPRPGDLGDEPDRPLLRALGAVLGDLADLRFDAEWTGVHASDVGAPHPRFRVFILAWPAAADGHSPGPQVWGGIRDDDGPQLPPPLGSRRDRGARRPGTPDVERHPFWGDYTAAIDHWGRVLGRVAPDPIERGSRGAPRLSAAFTEWHMGLPAGHVTGVPGLTREEQIRAAGNGVVPAQGAAAIRHLLQYAPARRWAA